MALITVSVRKDAMNLSKKLKDMYLNGTNNKIVMATVRMHLKQWEEWYTNKKYYKILDTPLKTVKNATKTHHNSRYYVAKKIQEVKENDNY